MELVLLLLLSLVWIHVHIVVTPPLRHLFFPSPVDGPHGGPAVLPWCAHDVYVIALVVFFVVCEHLLDTSSLDGLSYEVVFTVAFSVDQRIAAVTVDDSCNESVHTLHSLRFYILTFFFIVEGHVPSQND